MNPNPIGSEIHGPLNLGFFLRHIAVEYERHTVDGVDVTKRIIAHTDTPIVSENPLRNYAIKDWNVGHVSDRTSLSNAAADGTPPEYGIEERKDVEMVMPSLSHRSQAWRQFSSLFPVNDPTRRNSANPCCCEKRRLARDRRL